MYKVEAKRVSSLILAFIVAIVMLVPMEADAATRMTSGKVTGIKAVSYNSTTIKISWSKKSRASGYKIYRATSKNGKYRLVKNIRKGSITSWKNSKVSTEKTYYYKVKAYQQYKRHKKYRYRYTKYSNKVHSYARSSVRNAKTHVDVNGTELMWNKISGASGYKVYRATSSGGKYSLLKTVKGEGTVRYSTFAEGTKFYKVRAYKTINGKTVYSNYSNVVKIAYASEPSIDDEEIDETAGNNYPIAQSISVETNGKSVMVEWSGDSNFEGTYELQKSKAASAYDWTTIAKGEAINWEGGNGLHKLSYRDADVERGARYAYRIRYNYEDEYLGNWCKEVIVDIPLVETPDQLCVSTSGELTHISWGKVEGASYVLESRSGADGIWSELDVSEAYQDSSTAERMMLDMQTEKDTTYYFRIKAHIEDDYSAYSNPVALCTVTPEDDLGYMPGDPECNHEWKLIAEQNTMCFACGYYFRNGMSEVTAHGKFHALAGEGGSYGTAEYRCVKCGAYHN